MLFEWQSDNVVTDPGSNFCGWLFFTASTLEGYNGPAEGQLLIIDYYNIREVFTYKTVFDPSKNELPRKSSSETASAWIARVMDALSKNFNIRSRYVLSIVPGPIQMGSVGGGGLIDYSAACIEFLAREKTEDSHIDVVSQIGGSTNYTNIILYKEAGAQPAYTENLRVYAELFAVVDGMATKLIESSMPADRNGIVRWDVSLPISSLLELHGMDRPDFDSSAISFGKGVVSYFINYTEVSGANQQTAGFQFTAEKWAVLGGVSKNRIGITANQALVNEGLTDWLLPSSERSQKILPAQQLWLSWINLVANLQNVTLRLDIEYDNDTRWVVNLPVPDVAKFQKIIVPVDMEALEVNTYYPEYNVVAYSVELRQNGIPVSTRMKYVIDDRYLDYSRVFLFQNSYGSYETLYTYGRKVTSYDIEKSTARLMQIKDFVLQNSTDIDFDIAIRNKEKISTGFKSREAIHALRDFFLSREKYAFIDGQWWPINLASTTIEEHTDGENLHALSFEITGGHLEELWNNNKL